MHLASAVRREASVHSAMHSHFVLGSVHATTFRVCSGTDCLNRLGSSRHAAQNVGAPEDYEDGPLGTVPIRHALRQASAATGSASVLWQLIGLRLLLGVGESVIFPAGLCWIHRNVDEHRRGLAAGIGVDLRIGDVARLESRRELGVA